MIIYTMSSSPHIAICYWGLTRSTKHVYPTHHANLFDPLRAANIPFDVYMHTWKTPDNRVWNWTVDVQPDYDEYKLLSPDHYVIEPQSEFVNALAFDKYYYSHDVDHEWLPELVLNHLCALESQKRVANMCVSSGIPYTHVMFVRPDVRIDAPLPVSHIFRDNWSDNRIILPHNNHYAGYNDRFAIMTYENMMHYSHRINRAAHYRKTVGRIVSEIYAKHVIDTHYSPEFVEFPFVLVRPDLSIM